MVPLIYAPVLGGSSHFDPSNIPLRDLANIRCSIWTVRGPWRFGPRPLDPSNITALEYIYSYGDAGIGWETMNNIERSIALDAMSKTAFALNDTQKAMIATYKSFGYTHVAFGPPCAASYHGQYPDIDFMTPEMFERWLDWVQMFWDNGLIPVIFLHKDGTDFDENYALFDHLLRNNARAQKLIRIVVPTGWEPTRYDWSSRTWGRFLDWIAELLPNALRCIHTVTDVDAPVGSDALWDDNGKGNGQGWAYVAPRMHCWLIQNGAYDSAPDVNPSRDGFAGQFDRGDLGRSERGVAWHFLNAIDGWPRGSAWGPDEMIYLIAFENTSFEAYWRNLAYPISCAWNDLAMSYKADGYGDSGTVAVPGREVP